MDSGQSGSVADQTARAFEQIRIVLERSVRTVEELFGSGHPHVATALQNLATSLRIAGRQEEADAAEARAAAIRDRFPFEAAVRRASPGIAPAVVGVGEAARYLAISADTLYGLVRSGEVPHTRVGKSIRFRIADLDRFLEERTTREWTRVDARGRPRLRI